MLFLGALFIFGGFGLILWGFAQPVIYAGTYWTVGLLCFIVAGIIIANEYLREIKQILLYRGQSKQVEPEHKPQEPPKKKGLFSP